MIALVQGAPLQREQATIPWAHISLRVRGHVMLEDSFRFTVWTGKYYIKLTLKQWLNNDSEKVIEMGNAQIIFKMYLVSSKHLAGVMKSSMGISSGATFSSFFNFFFSRSLTICSLLGSTFFFFLGSALKMESSMQGYSFKTHTQI